MRVMTEYEVRNLARRVGEGGRFNVPPGTILTPMARDYLRSRSIEIVEGERKSSSGAGDDALVEAVAAEVSRVLEGGARGAAPGPQALTQEVMGAKAAAHSANRAVVWAIGGDRPGILAAVAELLGKRKVNIIEISQTILSGVFAMVVIIDLSSVDGQFGELKAELEQLGKSLQINISAQRDDIFQFMHRI